MNATPNLSRAALNFRVCLIAFVVAVAATFYWVNYLPQPSRMIWMERLHADPIRNERPIRYNDLKAVLSGIECDRAGLNAYDPCLYGAKSMGIDAVHFNYPVAVLWLGRLLPASITVADGDWIGPIIGVAFLLTLGFMFSGTAAWQAIYCCALIVSPPVMKGLDLANYDLVVFCLIFLNFRFLDRWSNAASYVAAFAIGMLKLFPIAAILGLVRATRESRRLFWLTVAAEAVFVVLFFDNLRVVKATTPQTYVGSFGHPVLFFIAAARFPAATWLPRMALPALIAVTIPLAYAARRSRAFWRGFVNGGNIAYQPLFLAGASIFSLCFSIGSNANYRSTFVLFTVPYLLSLAQFGGRYGRVAGVVLGTLLCAFWLTAIDGPAGPLLLQAAMTWPLFAFFASVCFATLFDELEAITSKPQSQTP